MKINPCVSIISFIALFFALSLNSSAQVTIGSHFVPLPGALLQLKQTDDEGVNAAKGLGLPRVALTTLARLSDVGVPSEEEEAHTGLLVYSAQENLCGLEYIYQGPHIWSGTKWEYLGEKIEQSSEIMTFTDSRDGEKYRYRDFGTIAGVWMLDDMRALVYDGTGEAPELSGKDQDGSGTRKQFAYPAPSGIGIDDLYYKKQPAIGILYNWPAAINLGDGGIVAPGSVNEGESGTALHPTRQGICPSGWHLPSDMEWNDIESVIAKDPALASTNSGTTWDDAWRVMQGQRPATEGNAHGKSMISHCQPIAHLGGASNGLSLLADRGGFNVLLVGDLLDEILQFFGQRVSFWSSSSAAAGSAWARVFFASSSSVARGDNNKARLYSVRCKKD